MPILAILGLSVLYGYINGLHGSASVVAPVVSTRALGPRMALVMAAVGMAVGPFILGSAVANTLGEELLTTRLITIQVLVAALIGAIAWSGLMLRAKIPCSISHALIGGLLGATLAAVGPSGVQITGLNKVLLALFLSPVLGLIVAFLLVKLTYHSMVRTTPSSNWYLRRAQIAVSMLVAIAFGANNGQKIVAVMTLGLVASGSLKTFTAPLWVVGVSSASVALGTLAGGWGVIETLSRGLYKIRPVHGFGAEVAACLVIFGAALVGGPISGSHVVTFAIVGSGCADRVRKVRWKIAKHIVISSLLTIPLSALVSFLVYAVLLH